MQLRVLALAATALAIGVGVWLLLGGDAEREREVLAEPGVGEAEAGIDAHRLVPVQVSDPRLDDEAWREAVPASGRWSAEPREQRSPAIEDAGLVQCTVYGRVTDTSGERIDRDRIGLGFVPANGERLVVGTDAEGSYLISGLAPGSWIISCGVPGFRPFKQEILLDTKTSVLRKDVVLEPSIALKIKVLDIDGRPFFESLREKHPGPRLSMVPVATEEHPGKTFNEVTGSLNNPFGVGRFRQNGFIFDKLPPEYIGILVLKGEPPVFVSLVMRHTVLATQHVEPGVEEVTFVLTPDMVLETRASLRLRVIDAETGAPIEGARPSLMGGSYHRPERRSDADGGVHLEDREPGIYTLSIHAEGNETYRREVELTPGGVTDLGTIALRDATWISGRIVDAEGKPVQTRIAIGMIDSVDRSVKMVRYQSWSSDAAGAFLVAGLGPGEYLIRTRVGARQQTESASHNHVVSTVGGSVEDLTIEVVPLSRMVFELEREDWESLRYSASDAQGFQRAGGRIWDSRRFSVSLPTGSYRVTVTDGEGALLVMRTVELGDNPVTIEVPR